MNLLKTENSKQNILYVFGGEKAQGAEIVIERLMYYNANKANIHLLLAPGKFATDLLNQRKPYQISTLNDLKKLNRTSGGKFGYYIEGMSNYFKVSFKVYWYIKKHKIDLVHANTMVAASYLIPLITLSELMLPKVKWIWSDHDLNYFSKLDTLLSKQCAKVYHKTLVVSNVLKKKYLPTDKVVILYNGLDPDSFKPNEGLRGSFRNKNGFGQDDIIIGLAGKIIPDKGQLKLAMVVDILSKQFTNIKLVLAGNYPMETPDYNKKVKALVAGNENIIYAGYIDQVNEFFNGCDIVVNNSTTEPLGTTIYEAMACEKIVVAANIGGTPEIVTDKINGFLFARDEEDGLLQTLLHVIKNYSTLNHIRLAAREKVLHQFTVSAMAENYDAILRSL